MKEKVCGRMYRWWVPAIIVVLAFPFAYADCPESQQGKYPGWAERFYGELGLANSTPVENFDVTVTRIFDGNAVQVDVLKDKSQYISRGSIASGQDGILKKSDILIELYNGTASKAYVGIYTPERANVTANVTNVDLLTSEGVRVNLLPGEEFRVDFSLNNTGELKAMGIDMTPQFGDFEILRTDAMYVQSLCQGSSYDFKYVLKTPDFRKVFNYTLYLQLDYFDENVETGEVNRRTTYYPFEVEITPVLIEISRRSGNWTLKNPGRDVSVRVTVNNTGDEGAYNVGWSADIPLYVEVKQGTASFNGSILEGRTRVFIYTLVSDDPAMCQAVSRVTYEDRGGNNYMSFSNSEDFRFSPFITIDKRIGALSWHIDPTRNVMAGTTTWAINEAKWWDSRTSETVVNSPREISFNQTKQLDISVKIKNMGNAVARGVFVNDTLGGLKSTGTTFWEGELDPDEEVSYAYTVDVLKHGNISLVTDVTYLDVDPASFKPPMENITGDPKLRYCTVTLKNVTFKTRETFYGLRHDVNINQSQKLKVLGGSEFDFNVSISNNGSDSVHDVLIKMNTSDLRSQIRYGGEILEGQSFYYVKELRAKYYPDGTSRNWGPANVTYSLVLRAPDVEVDTDFTIVTAINYTDFWGDTYSKNTTTNLTVVKAVPAYEVVTIKEKDLSVTPGAPKEMDMGSYGDAYMKLKSTGYKGLENITIKITVPVGLEVYSNDTAWKGRIDAQLRRLNETWYGFTGDMSWNGSLNVSEKQTLLLLIRGKRAGMYDVNYVVDYDKNQLAGSFATKVRGAILRVNKSINASRINVTGITEVTVSVENIGEATARDVFIVDYVPPNFKVSGNTKANRTELEPGDGIVLKYMLKAQVGGNYILEKTSVSWTDELGNVYQKKSDAFKVVVTEEEPKVVKEQEPGQVSEEEIRELSPKQAIVTAVLSLVFFWVVLKLLFMTKPVSKE